MAQIYKHTKTGVKATLIEINEKTKNVTLQKADGKYTSTTLGPFEKYWRLISEDTTPVETPKTEEQEEVVESEENVAPEEEAATEEEVVTEESEETTETEEEPEVEEESETEEQIEETLEKEKKSKKEKKTKKEKKDALPVRDALENQLKAKNVDYKNVGKRVRILVDGKTELYFIPNRTNARMYVKESSKYFDGLSEVLDLFDNKNVKSAYKKTAIVEFETIEKLF